MLVCTGNNHIALGAAIVKGRCSDKCSVPHLKRCVNRLELVHHHWQKEREPPNGMLLVGSGGPAAVAFERPSYPDRVCKKIPSLDDRRNPLYGARRTMG